MSGPFPKCSVPGCNQHRCRDSELCGDHRHEQQELQEIKDVYGRFRFALEHAATLDDIKAVIGDLIDVVFERR